MSPQPALVRAADELVEYRCLASQDAVPLHRFLLEMASPE
jgi:hypothetical protein